MGEECQFGWTVNTWVKLGAAILSSLVTITGWFATAGLALLLIDVLYIEIIY